jgi:hypothetical protein
MIQCGLGELMKGGFHDRFREKLGVRFPGLT